MVLPYVLSAFLPVLTMVGTDHRIVGEVIGIVIVILAVVQYAFYLHLHGRSLLPFKAHLPRW